MSNFLVSYGENPRRIDIEKRKFREDIQVALHLVVGLRNQKLNLSWHCR